MKDFTKDTHNNHCDCGHEHAHNCDNNHDNCNCHNHLNKPRLVKMCVLEENIICSNCGACDICDLDPNKKCDNCGKCLDTLNTNDKGYVSVPIDKIIMGENDDGLEQLLKMYGLDDEDEED